MHVARLIVAATVLALSAAAAAASEPGLARPDARDRGVRVVSAIEVGGAPSNLLAAAGAIWTSLGRDGIAHIDPATNDAGGDELDIGGDPGSRSGSGTRTSGLASGFCAAGVAKRSRRST